MKISAKPNDLSRKQRRKLERKFVKIKRNAWHHKQKVPISIDEITPSVENVEKQIKKKKKKSKKTNSDELTFDEQAAKEQRKKNLLEDNQIEDTNIKKLEKLLKIKSNRQTYLKGFVDDGLDFLLDFCDKTKRKQIMLTEEGNAWYDDDIDEDQQWLAKKQKHDNENPTSIVKVIEDESEDLEEEEEEEEIPVMKEDIYGRSINAKGDVIKSGKYLPPALRNKLNSSEETSLNDLKRRLQGQLNRLSEKNISTILNEIQQIYQQNSRALINSCLYEIYHESLLSSISLINESLLAEHALVIALLHANIGLEIGSYLFENFLQIFLEHFHDDISNKINDNLILFLSYCYAFYITNSKILFDLAYYLLNNEQLNEKRLELILLLLRTIGFLLRKDNPLELKKLLQQLKTSSISISSKRMEFMLMTIQSLKNNDIRKLPGEFDFQRIERLRKIYKNLIENQSTQTTNMLNVGLQDFFNVKEQGRWWIVGSAWQKQSTDTNRKDRVQQIEFDEKILKLAKKQHMNTDLRKTIFATLITSEDCDDAVEKLHKLNLNKIQEREIIHVTVHCCLHEKTYNPYYTLILQRFSHYDRRFQMSLQYHIWDRFKDLSLLNKKQLKNFSSTLAQLLITKSITMNIFKNFNFVELSVSAKVFLVDLFVELFNEIDETSLKTLFEFSLKQNFQFVKDALRLFLSHFILKKSNYSDIVHRRCQFVLNQLKLD